MLSESLPQFAFMENTSVKFECCGVQYTVLHNSGLEGQSGRTEVPGSFLCFAPLTYSLVNVNNTWKAYMNACQTP